MATTTPRDYEREILLRNTGALERERLDSLGGALGITERGIQDLERERARRGSSLSGMVGKYEAALNSGTARALVGAAVDLRRLRQELPIKFADAAYEPNYALLDEVRRAIPALMQAADPREKQVAAIAWETYLKSARLLDGNALGTELRMLSTYGPPPATVTTGALRVPYAALQEATGTAKANAAQFEQQMNAADQIATNWSTFVAKNANDPTFDSASDEAYQRFQKENEALFAKLPGANAPGVDLFRKYMLDPEKNKAFFSDIDATLAERTKTRNEYRAMLGMGGEAAPQVEESERAILAGWVRREDVQEWAKQHGFNLGRAVPVPAGSKLEADIKAGYYPQGSLVNGLLYTSSPDDMRAMRLAYRQMQMDPQKNILYNLGLAGDRTRRGMTEVEVTSGEAPKIVSIGFPTAEGGKDVQVAQLSNGAYAASEDAGATWTALPEADAQTLMKDVAFENVLEPTAAPGIQAPTKKVLIEERGRMYGDPMGSIRGVDRTPGSPTFNRPIVLTGEEVVRRTRLGEERYRKPLGETVGGITAGMTEKREGFAPVDTMAEWNAQDIGKAPVPSAERARAETTRKVQELPSEPTAAVPERVSPEVVDLSTVGAPARPTSLQGKPGAPSGLLRATPPLQTLPKQGGEVKPPRPEEVDTEAAGTTTSKPVTPSASVSPQQKAFKTRRGVGTAAGLTPMQVEQP